MHGQCRQRKKILEREIAVTDRIQAICSDPGKSETLRECIAIQRKRTSRQRAGAEWASIRAFCRRQKPFRVTIKRFSMRQQPVREQQRLGVLHVSGARHGNSKVFLGLLGKRSFEQTNCGNDFPGSLLHIHPKFRRHHFIAAAAGVQLGAERPQLFDQRGLGEMMHVFRWRRIKPGQIGLSALFNLIERLNNRRTFFGREDFSCCDGSRPSAIECEFLRQQTAIETPRAFKLIERRVGSALEPASPHFLRTGSGHQARAFCVVFSVWGTCASCGTVIGSAKRLMKPSASFGL